MDLPQYYSTASVAAKLNVSPRTLRDWIADGCPTPHGRVKLEAAKLGRSWKIHEDWLVLFEHRVRPRGGRPDLDAE